MPTSLFAVSVPTLLSIVVLIRGAFLAGSDNNDNF